MKKFAAIFAAMLISAFATGTVLAADFTPSVEGKDAPTVNVQVDESGNEYVAVIHDADGNQMQNVTADKLIVTPVSQKDKASSPDISARLNEAYEQVQAATTLTDLTPEVGAVLMQMPTQVAVEDLVIRDLFDISMHPSEEAELQAGKLVTLTFTVNIAEGKPLIVMQYVNGVWKVIDPSNVVINGDGTVTVTLSSTGTIAFATQKDAATDSEDAVAYLFQSDDQNNAVYAVSTQNTAASSDTASQLPYLIGVGAAVVVAAGAASALLLRKDK